MVPHPSDTPTPPPCGICGDPASTSDGIVGFDLCDDPRCLDAAWDIAFAGPEVEA